MTGPGHNTDTGAQLRSIVERIERLEAEIKDLNSDKSEVYSEAKANGYEPAIIRKVVAIRRKDANVVAEEDAVLETYKRALGMA